MCRASPLMLERLLEASRVRMWQYPPSREPSLGHPARDHLRLPLPSSPAKQSDCLSPSIEIDDVHAWSDDAFLHHRRGNGWIYCDCNDVVSRRYPSSPRIRSSSSSLCDVSATARARYSRSLRCRSFWAIVWKTSSVDHWPSRCSSIAPRAETSWRHNREVMLLVASLSRISGLNVFVRFRCCRDFRLSASGFEFTMIYVRYSSLSIWTDELRMEERMSRAQSRRRVSTDSG